MVLLILGKMDGTDYCQDQSKSLTVMTHLICKSRSSAFLMCDEQVSYEPVINITSLLMQ